MFTYSEYLIRFFFFFQTVVLNFGMSREITMLICIEKLHNVKAEPKSQMAIIYIYMRGM